MVPWAMEDSVDEEERELIQQMEDESRLDHAVFVMKHQKRRIGGE